MAAPSCRWKLPLPNHVTPPMGFHSSSPQTAGTAARYHQYFCSSPCRPLSNSFSLPVINHLSFLPLGPQSPALLFSFCPYHFLSRETSFTQMIARNKVTMRTEKISKAKEFKRFQRPRPYACQVLEQARQGSRHGMGLVLDAKDLLSIVKMGKLGRQKQGTH